LWFYTISGFDVLQEDIILNQTREPMKYSVKKINSLIRECRWGRIGRCWDRIVLRRNSDPVEVDPLMNTSSTSSYMWEPSERSKSIFSQNGCAPLFNEVIRPDPPAN
jgi:hypothetical protein